MAKKPTIEMITYSKPANLPGFLVELMCHPVVRMGLDLGTLADTARTVKMFRYNAEISRLRGFSSAARSGLDSIRMTRKPEIEV